MDTNREMKPSASGEHRPLACWRRLPAVAHFTAMLLVTDVVTGAKPSESNPQRRFFSDHLFDEPKWNRQHSLRWKSARWSSSSRRMVGIWIERAVATGNIGMIRKKVWSLLRESPATILRRARKIVSLNKQD